METLEARYKPKKIEDLICPKYILEEICKFMKQFLPGNSRYCGNLFIAGDHGVGKTTIIDIIIKMFNAEKINCNLANISIKKKKTKNFEVDAENFYHTCYKKNINEFINTENNTKIKVLVFDDFTITTNGHCKEVVKTLFKENQGYKSFPIIYISTHHHSKFTNELKKLLKYEIKSSSGKNNKYINKIDIPVPDSEELSNLLRRIIKKEEIHMSSLQKSIVLIKKNCQNDLRKLLQICSDLKSTFGTNQITATNLDDFFTTQKRKDIDPGIYISAKNVLDAYTSVENIMNIYNTERIQVPLMVHENYPENISSQYPNINFLETINMIDNIADKISEADKIDGMIFTNQFWTLQNSHGFYSCVLPSYHGNIISKKNNNTYNMVYTRDFNRTSIKKNNEKNIRKFKKNKNLKNFKLNDILQLGFMLKQYFDENNHNKIIEFGNNYNFCLADIVKLIKINKMTKYNITIPTKTKQMLESKLNLKSKKEKEEDSDSD